MKKRWISFCLLLAMLLSIAVPAYAIEPTSAEQTEGSDEKGSLIASDLSELTSLEEQESGEENASEAADASELQQSPENDAPAAPVSSSEEEQENAAPDEVSEDIADPVDENAALVEPTYTGESADEEEKSLSEEDPSVRSAASKAEQEAPAAPELISVEADRITIKARSGEEYSIDGGETWVMAEDGEETVCFDALTPETSYELIARRAESEFLAASPASEAAKVTTPAVSTENAEAAEAPDASENTAAEEDQESGKDSEKGAESDALVSDIPEAKNDSIALEGVEAEKAADVTEEPEAEDIVIAVRDANAKTNADVTEVLEAADDSKAAEDDEAKKDVDVLIRTKAETEDKSPEDVKAEESNDETDASVEDNNAIIDEDNKESETEEAEKEDGAIFELDFSEGRTSSDELFAVYVQRMFDGGSSASGAMLMRSIPHTEALNSECAEIEQRLKTEVRKIAEGEQSSTTVEIDYGDLGYTWEDLNPGSSDPEVSGRLQLIFTVLNRDATYELYWWGGKTNGVKITGTILRVTFIPAPDYKGSSDGVVDTGKITAAKKAVANANAIVSQYASYSDTAKLLAFYNTIRELTEYNWDVANDPDRDPSTTGSNPWNLIYVFDGDPATKVICTGYSKAFEYLCNRSTFQKDINCYCVSGTLYLNGSGGTHTWNIVTCGSEHYLMDVTNGRFLNYVVAGDVNTSYTCIDGGVYTYDSSTRGAYSSSALTVNMINWGYSNGILTVTCIGDFPDFFRFKNSYFGNEYSTVKKIVLKSAKTSLCGGLSRICSYAFYGSTGLEEISLPDGLVTLGDYSFSGCSSLKKVTLPSSLKTIGAYAFCDCGELVTLSIPSSVTSIGNYAFYMCKKLSGAMTIPSGVKTLGECTFFYCEKLSSVTLPAGLTSLGKYALGCLKSVSTITFNGNAPSFDANAFTGTKATAYYPVGNSTWTASVKQNYGGTITWKTSPLPAPVLTEAFNSATGVRVSWNAVAGAAKYQLLRKNLTKGETSWSVIGETTELTLIDKSAVSASRYTYSVRAVSSDGVIGSCDETGRTCTYIAKADITELKAVSNGVSITWSKPTGAKNFRVMRRADGTTKWTVIKVVEGTSFVDTTAKTGTKYWYTVRGVSMDNTVVINSYNGTGWSLNYAAAPVLTEAFNSSTGVRVSWKAVANAAKYRLLRKNLTLGETAWSTVGETNALSLIDKTAKSSHRYCYTVECIDSNGRTSSTYNATGRTCTYIAMSKITSIGSVSNGIKLIWSQPAGSKNFRIFRKTDGGSWVALKDIQGTSYVDTTAVKGVKYWYTVRAITLAGDMYINSYNASGWSCTR